MRIKDYIFYWRVILTHYKFVFLINEIVSLYLKPLILKKTFKKEEVVVGGG